MVPDPRQKPEPVPPSIPRLHIQTIDPAEPTRLGGTVQPSLIAVSCCSPCSTALCALMRVNPEVSQRGPATPCCEAEPGQRWQIGADMRRVLCSLPGVRLRAPTLKMPELEWVRFVLVPEAGSWRSVSMRKPRRGEELQDQNHRPDHRFTLQ